VNRRAVGDRGSATVEIVLLAPVFLLLLAFVILAGGVESSRADVEGVAHASARAISLSRTPAAAIDTARSNAASSLGVGSSTCRHMGWAVHLDATEVTVTVRCSVDLSAASALPVPGSITVAASATEVFDHYREATSP
jgi:Flp pilus assembly protein TadG